MRRRSGNVLIPAFDIRFATGDGDDVPVVQSKKVAQKISAHDSRRAGNQRLLAARHERAPYVLVSSKVILEVWLNGIGARLLPKSIPRSILHSRRRPVIAVYRSAVRDGISINGLSILAFEPNPDRY